MRLENWSLLMRRWEVAQVDALDARELRRWFPQQGHLLELLQVCTKEEVERMADTSLPLFGMHLRCTTYSLEACAIQPLQQPHEIESANESSIALIARLDAVRTSTAEACTFFGLSLEEAIWLQRFRPQELNLLARDSSMAMVPLASMEYFTTAAMPASPLTKTAQRTHYLAVTRSPAMQIQI